MNILFGNAIYPTPSPNTTPLNIQQDTIMPKIQKSHKSHYGVDESHRSHLVEAEASTYPLMTIKFKLTEKINYIKLNLMQRTKPYMIDWAITMNCNLNCQHCRGMTPDELSTEETLKVAQEIVELNPEWVIIEGGEPLMRDGIWEILKVLQELDINLITNGTLINSENIKQLKDLGIKVMISFDSPYPEVYERLRAGASFNEVLRNGEKLANQGILHSINFALSKYNYKDIPKMFSLTKSIGAEMINILGLKPCEKYQEQLLSKEEYKAAIISACESSKNGISFYFDEPFFHACLDEWNIKLPQLSTGTTVQKESKILTPATTSCIFGEYIFIEPNGEIKPCTFAPYVLGNAKEGVIKVWESMKKSEFLSKIKKPETRTGACKICKHLDKCRGCRSRTYALTNDWFASDPACPLSKNG